MHGLVHKFVNTVTYPSIGHWSLVIGDLLFVIESSQSQVVK